MKGITLPFYLSALLLMGCNSSPKAYLTEEGAPAHHTPNGFANPYPVDNVKRSFFKYWKMRLFGEEFPDYSLVADQVPVARPDLTNIHNPPSDLQVTWIGHATFLIQYANINLLTDPHFSERASPVSFAGPRRLVPLPLEIKELPKIDYVIISHTHYDHLDKESILQLGSSPQYLVPLGVKAILTDWGIEEKKIHEQDWWQTFQRAEVQLTTTPAHHFSARTLFDRNQTLWSSWHLQLKDKAIWFAGDTAYNPYQFREIGERFKQIDLALIPIGAYGPRWFMRDNHINPEEAVQIHMEIGSKQSIAMHWGTFQLTSEPMLEPPKRLLDEMNRHQLPPFKTVAIGETRIFP